MNSLCQFKIPSHAAEASTSWPTVNKSMTDRVTDTIVRVIVRDSRRINMVENNDFAQVFERNSRHVLQATVMMHRDDENLPTPEPRVWLQDSGHLVIIVDVNYITDWV